MPQGEENMLLGSGGVGQDRVVAGGGGDGGGDGGDGGGHARSKSDDD